MTCHPIPERDMAKGGPGTAQAGAVRCPCCGQPCPKPAACPTRITFRDRGIDDIPDWVLGGG